MYEVTNALFNSPGHQLASCLRNGTVSMGPLSNVADVLDGSLQLDFTNGSPQADELTHDFHLITVM